MRSNKLGLAKIDDCIKAMGSDGTEIKRLHGGRGFIRDSVRFGEHLGFRRDLENCRDSGEMLRISGIEQGSRTK